MHDTPFDFDDEEHVVAAEDHGVDGEEVGGHDVLGLGTEKLGQGRPWRRRTLVTLPLETVIPNFFSSPAMRS